MGKIIDELEKQKEIPEFKDDALKCIAVYNKIKELNNGKVWQNIWNFLVRTIVSVSGPDISDAGYKLVTGYRTTYHLTPIGELVFKGMQYETDRK